MHDWFSHPVDAMKHGNAPSCVGKFSSKVQDNYRDGLLSGNITIQKPFTFVADSHNLDVFW